MSTSSQEVQFSIEVDKALTSKWMPQKEPPTAPQPTGVIHFPWAKRVWGMFLLRQPEFADPSIPTFFLLEGTQKHNTLGMAENLQCFVRLYLFCTIQTKHDEIKPQEKAPI